MAWGIRIFAVMILMLLLWALLQPATRVEPVTQLADSNTAARIVAPTVSSLNASAPVRVTVYQQQDDRGVTSFSDRADRGQPHVIDHADGTTYQSTYQGAVPPTASLSYTPTESPAGYAPIKQLKQDNARFQQQVQHGKQQRMQQMIGE